LASSNVPILRSALAKFDFIGEASWTCAIQGDAAAAIRIALRMMHNHGPTAVVIDIPLTAVLSCAIAGDAAAGVLISEALRRRARFDPRTMPLSASWLVANFSKSAKNQTQNRSARQRTPPRDK